MNKMLDMKKPIFGSQQWLRFHIWFITTLYCKMLQIFYYKMQKKFNTKFVRFFITPRDSFITKCNRFFITKCDSFITKCNSYHKMRQCYYKMQCLLQNASAHRTIWTTIKIMGSHEGRKTDGYEGYYLNNAFCFWQNLQYYIILQTEEYA